MRASAIRVSISGLAIGLSAASALAQWSSNPAANLKIADGPNDQVQPKIQPTSDGGCYVSWFDNGSINYKSDTWTWSGTTWTKSSASGPSARIKHGMAFDSARGRAVVFGGSGAAGLLSDTWEWDGAAWAQVGVSGPSARERFAMAFDAARGQTVLFGGLDSASALLGDTWVYNGTAWTHLSPANAPTPRKHSSMAYDPVRQVVVLFGGGDAGGVTNDTWEWNGTNWTQIAAATPPPARNGHGLAYDFVNSKVLLFGGQDSSSTALQDTWLYDGAAWTQQAPATSPNARLSFGIANDFTASGLRIVVFGGNSGSFNLGNMYEWSGTTWGSKTTTPTARNNPAMAYDSVHSQTVLFGGVDQGGYDVYLQRLNSKGIEQWAHNGIQVCDRGVSSTVDYDMIVDATGNSVVTYNDDQVAPGGVQQISVSKVSPAGAILWKSTISQATSSASANNPHITQLSDGTYVVAYALSAPSPGVWVMQRLDTNGNPLWTAPGITVTEATHYEAVSDIKPSGSGFVVMWIRGQTNSLSNKGLRIQKFDATGAPQWTGTQSGSTAVTNAGTPVVVYLGSSTAPATSIQNGYFPTMIADGAGGVVVGWYENTGSRNAYIQHVLFDGSLKFAAPVPNTGPTARAARIRVGAGLGYNVGTGEYYLASPETDASTQAQNSTFAQKFDSTGNRLWSDTGTTIIPISTATQQSFVQCQPFGSGCMVFFMDTRSATTRVIDSARVNGDASIAWHNLVNNDSSTDKSRLTSCLSTSGFAMLAYGWGNSGATDIAAQNVNGDGTLGNPPACYANCDGSTTPPVLNVLDFSCFLNRFAAGDSYANCDQSTTPPVLNVLDFSCFLNHFAAGCP